MIEWVAETASTNDDLLAGLAAAAPPPEGVWRAAHRQTAGRGRAGRVWNDGAGNFMGSTVVHLRDGDPPAHSLALLTALAVHATVDGCVGAGERFPDLRIKWPNDILIDGAKCAGLLLERRQDSVVIGVGVNLAQAPVVAGRRTTALAEHGVVIAGQAFGDVLAQRFAAAMTDWRGGAWPERIIAMWSARAHPLGTPLRLSDGPDEGREGVFAGLNPDGSLRLRLSDASIISIHAGDVTPI